MLVNDRRAYVAVNDRRAYVLFNQSAVVSVRDRRAYATVRPNRVAGAAKSFIILEDGTGNLLQENADYLLRERSLT